MEIDGTTCCKPIGACTISEAQLKKGGTFVPNGNALLSQDASLLKAREDLEKYRAELIGAFGQNYQGDPRFNDAIRAVASGRAPRLVLADYAPGAKPGRPTGGTGWAW